MSYTYLAWDYNSNDDTIDFDLLDTEREAKQFERYIKIELPNPNDCGYKGVCVGVVPYKKK